MIHFVNEVNGYGRVFDDAHIVQLEELDNECTRIWLKHGSFIDSDRNFEAMVSKFYDQSSIFYLTGPVCAHTEK